MVTISILISYQLSRIKDKMFEVCWNNEFMNRLISEDGLSLDFIRLVFNFRNKYLTLPS